MNVQRAGSKELIREINETLVLNELRRLPTSSRSDVARVTGLSAPTVSTITAKLIGLGLIEEREIGSPTGGRPPIMLAFRPSAGYVVGIKLTETDAIGVLTDLNAQVVASQVTALTSRSVEAVVSAVTSTVQALRPSATGAPIYGLGLGLGGIVNRETGVVRHATYFNWKDEPLAERINRTTGLTVVVDNDVNCLVATEQEWGAGRGIGNFAVVSLGRGVGLGLVVDGRLFRGATGGAGEFGHTKVTAGGPLCPCGARGCLEAIVGEPALAAAATSAIGQDVTVDAAVALARAGNPQLAALFADAGAVLGRAVGNLVNIFNPSRLIFAGEGTRFHDLLEDTFRAELTATVFDGLGDELSVHVEPWRDEAWARGATSLVLADLFQPNFRRPQADRPSLVALASR